MKYRGFVGDSLSVPAMWGPTYMDVIVACFVNRTLYTIFFFPAAWLPCFVFLTGHPVKLPLTRNSSSAELFKVIETQP